MSDHHGDIFLGSTLMLHYFQLIAYFIFSAMQKFARLELI